MKKLFFFGLICCCFASMTVFSAESLVSLYSLSLRFSPAPATSLGVSYQLTLTTDVSGTEMNGELQPLSTDAATSHGSIYQLDGDIFLEPIYGTLNLNIPQAIDVNSNGIPDFLEVGLAVSPTNSTTGTFQDDNQSGKLTAIWSRDAGSKAGTCKLTFDTYGLTFTTTFEIIQYSGILNYTSSGTSSSGTASLSKQGELTKALSGTMIFTKVSTNQLMLNAGTFQNEAQQALDYFPSDNLLLNGKSYVGPFEFHDGDPNTVVQDFVFWMFRVFDSNDSNQNGIPDIGDDSINNNTNAPSLAISRSGTNLLLSVSGQVGKTHDIEQSFSLSQANWTKLTSITLTNDPQVVQITTPTNSISFWRLKVP